MSTRMHPVWTLVLCAAAMLAINMGARQTLGLFLKPISQDLHLDRQVFSLSLALANLTWGFGAPFAGALSDRIGALKVILVGVAAYVGGLALMATAGGGDQVIAAGVLIGIGISGTGFTAIFGVIARAAPPEKRSSALSMTTMGSAIGQFVSLPFVHLLLDASGWVTTLLVMAATLMIMVPLGFVIGSRAASTGVDASAMSNQSLSAAIGEAIRYPSFLLLTAGFFVCGFHIAGVATHLPAFLQDKGFDSSLGAYALTVIGAGNIAGTYLCGRAGEVMPKHYALSALYALRGVVFLCLLYLPLTQTSVLIYSLALGFLWLGTIPLTTGLLVTFFGPRWLSTLYGIVFLSHQVGSFMGAWLGGWFYDHYKSYDLLWWASIAVAVLAAVIHLPIREQPAPRLAALPA